MHRQRTRRALRAEPADGVAPHRGSRTVGLVRKRRRGQERACTLETARLAEAEDWIAEYRVFFERRFDALERQLRKTTGSEEE